MSDQKYYQSQPEVLPETLPAGTRSVRGDEALTECRLVGGRYESDWVGLNGPGSLLASNVKWTSVQLPTSKPLESADRPIQAGDWVECLPGKEGLRLEAGARYQVDRETVSGWIVLVGRNFDFEAYRFKRVDGPHPQDSSECVHCGESAGCAENCVTRADEPKRHDPYTEHRLRIDELLTPYTTGESSRRLAAWSRAERPRGNPADRRAFALPHVWEEFDPLESR